MSEPKITVFTPSLGRTDLLARMIACFERQTYENRELVVIEDGGELDPQCGDRWEIVPVKRRFRSLAEKNNACIALASRDSQLIAKWDSDDCYLPHALEASVDALQRGEICQPRIACDHWDGEWVQITTHSKGANSVDVDFSFHSAWSYRRSFFEKMRGYLPGAQAGDDTELDRRRREMKIPSVGLDKKYPPFLFYNRPLPNRISSKGGSDEAYLSCAEGLKYIGKLPPYVGEPVWLWSIPTRHIERRW